MALTQYVFNRSATVQSIGLGGLIRGTYRRDSFMTFKDNGDRFERVTFAPISTLTELVIGPDDLDDLGGINPFAINPKDISNYSFKYIGKQKIDEITTHVFDVTPKVLGKASKSRIRVGVKRYFKGRISIDDRDLFIVRSNGKGVPEGNLRFPNMDTWRTNVDGKYWFPAYSATDDELIFKNGRVIKMRMRVRYDNYAKGRSEVIILDDEEIIDDPPKEKPKSNEPVKKDN